MNNTDRQYLDLMREIWENGARKDTRSGRVRSVFGRQMRFNLKEGFPLLTTKKVFTKGIIHELLWFISGSTNIKYLVEHQVNIWTDDAYRYYREIVGHHDETDIAGQPIEILSKEDFVQAVLDRKTLYLKSSGSESPSGDTYRFGDLGEMYGKNWRNFDGTFDQIDYVIQTIRQDPQSRRILLTCYNPATAGSAALYPCHILYQFYVNDGALSCMVECRSQDYFLGTVYNIASAALLTHMIAEVCQLDVGELIWVGGDVHLYENHAAAVHEQLSRQGSDTLPTLRFARQISSIDDFQYDDFIIENYHSDPVIKAPLSVG
ncbi:MAG: thymidylate synthase [Prevotella sp.]|nr:thymidylate synthase [Prevotella sp.]